MIIRHVIPDPGPSALAPVDRASLAIHNFLDSSLSNQLLQCVGRSLEVAIGAVVIGTDNAVVCKNKTLEQEYIMRPDGDMLWLCPVRDSVPVLNGAFFYGSRIETKELQRVAVREALRALAEDVLTRFAEFNLRDSYCVWFKVVLHEESPHE